MKTLYILKTQSMHRRDIGVVFCADSLLSRGSFYFINVFLVASMEGLAAVSLRLT